MGRRTFIHPDPDPPRMISKQDLQRLIDRPSGDRPVLSVFLDMSVPADNKRTHRIFLNQKRAQFDELDSDRENHHREAIGATFAQIDGWLENEYRQENRGAVIYAEVGGDWFEAMQFPVPVQNRLVVADRPVITPLAQVLESYDHHGVILLDREHVRILSVYFGTLLDEIEVRGDPFPTPHDVQAGGYSHKRYQRRKEEETKHFFKDFVRELDEFVSRYQPDDLIILGTDENVARFREFLPEKLRELVVYTGPMSVDESATEVMQRLQTHLDAEQQRETMEAVDTLLERVSQDYLATGGVQATLTALQEGKVDRLMMARELNRTGSRCAQCGFVFAREVSSCAYCGGSEFKVVDAEEELVRLAEGQGADVEFLEPGALGRLRGVGALLRF
jgi:peptide chain release factor subunit 1